MAYLIVIVVEPTTLKKRLLLLIDWRQKMTRFSLSFIIVSLRHSAYITFHTIMSFSKPCHMPFHKLMPPFTLRGFRRAKVVKSSLEIKYVLAIGKVKSCKTHRRTFSCVAVLSL